MPRVTVPVVMMEFEEGGHTIWIHGIGATVLRIKSLVGISTKRCQDNPVSHADILVPEKIELCLGPDADVIVG